MLLKIFFETTVRNSLSVAKHEHLSSYKASSNPHLSFSLQCRNWRHKKERFVPVRSASKEEAQKEDRTAGRRHHGGHGSVLFPAGTGEGARESITSGACCPMQATCRYIQISVSSFFFSLSLFCSSEWTGWILQGNSIPRLKIDICCVSCWILEISSVEKSAFSWIKWKQFLSHSTAPKEVCISTRIEAS